MKSSTHPPHRLTEPAVADASSNDAFDRLARLASRLLSVPMAVVCFVEEDGTNFCGGVGLPQEWTSAGQNSHPHPLCLPAPGSDVPLVVRDARDDAALRGNPAIGDCGVVACLGVPLVSAAGQSLGSFCAMDARPRDWTDAEVQTMRDLSASVVAEIELRKEVRERRVAERRLRIEHAVASVLASAQKPEEALAGVLEAIAESNGFQRAAMWIVDAGDDVIRCEQTWHAPGTPAADGFERATAQMHFARDQGLPGRVWASGRPAWLNDTQGDPNFPRAAAAGEAGLRSGFAFPVTLAGKVLGVMEFFCRDPRGPDAALLSVMEGVGAQIGQFVERWRADAARRQSEARLGAMVRSSLDCIVGMDHKGRVTEWNPAAERTFGYTRDEALGREMAALIIPPRFRDDHRKGLSKYLATGEGPVLGNRLQLWAVRKDDDAEFPVELTVTRVEHDGPPAFTGQLRDLTDQRRAEEQAQRGQALFKSITDATPDLISLYDVRANVPVYANREIASLLGYSPDELVAMGERAVAHFVHPDDMQMIMQVIADFDRLKDGEVLEYEYRARHKDGGYRWLYSRTVVLTRTPDGRTHQVLSLAQDVSRRKQHEVSLRASEELVRTIAENSTQGLAMMDEQGYCTYANKAWLDMTGYDAEEIRSKPLHDLVHHHYPDGRPYPKHECPIDRALPENFDVRAHEDLFFRKDGSTFPVLVAASPVFKNGKPVSTVIEIRDVTRRRRAEAALRAEKHVLELIATGRPLGEVLEVLAREVEAQSSDGMLCSVLLLDEVGQRLVHGAAPSLPEPYNAAISGVQIGSGVGSCGTAAFENRRVCVSDIATHPYWADFRDLAVSHGLRACCATPVRSSRGEVLGTVAMYYRKPHDPRAADLELMESATRLAGIVIERKIAEDRLRQALESEQHARLDAERASRIKDEFLATVSHELRTPLNAILGYSQLLRHGGGAPSDAGDAAEVIERNARVQAQIIEDLLDMSRIISGKLRLNVQIVDLADVVRAAVETVRPAALAKDIRLQVVLDPSANPISGDPARLQQVVWNLLSNAIKFTPKGGRVQAVLRPVNSHVEIAVADTGQGIKPEFLPHVFERFRQADASTTRRHGGLGLGLSIVKSLVELHGGSTRAHSPGEGRGATFVVSLPLSLVHRHGADTGDDREHPKAPTDSTHYDRPALDGVRVLAVDDEPDALQLVRRLLEDCGAEVILATSAHEAIAALDSRGADVIVSDIGMPEIDGYQFIRRVRQRGPQRHGQVPAAALTAFARSEDRTRALVAGFQTHIAKPVEPAELVFAVASLAGRTGIPQH